MVAIEDAILTESMTEFLRLSQMNWQGRNPIEAVLRARALQEISALSTAELARVAKMVADGMIGVPADAAGPMPPPPLRRLLFRSQRCR